MAAETPTNDPTAETTAHKPSLAADLRRLGGLAAKLGAILALVCHLLPPHYQTVCHAISTLCGGN